ESSLTHSLSRVSVIFAIYISFRYTTISCVLTFRIQIGKIIRRTENEYAYDGKFERRQIPMPEPNYADILASVEKHFPSHVLEELEAERKRKTRRARAAETQEIANNEATGNTVTPADDDAPTEMHG